MHQILTFDQKPHLRPQIDRLGAESWPAFLSAGETRHWDRLFTEFAPFQILFCGVDEEVVAVGHTIPVAWNGTFADLPATIDEIFDRAEASAAPNSEANTLCAMAAMVRSSHRGLGLGPELLQAMKAMAVRRGLASLIAPVRPTGKALYPLAAFERYVAWARRDGSPFDPWIRTHWKLGARPLGVAPRAATVTGSLAQWTEWTGLEFPESGDYVLAGALQPLQVDVARDEGCYVEPNYWMQHPL